MSSGSLALVLHAHLPFVRHPEHEEFLEEDWLFEAITETYLPLLDMMQRLVRDGVPFKLTMTLSPTLCDMLQDPLLQDRYVRYLDRSIDLAAREIERNRDDERLRTISRILSRQTFRTARASVPGVERRSSRRVPAIAGGGLPRDHGYGGDPRFPAAAATITGSGARADPHRARSLSRRVRRAIPRLLAAGMRLRARSGDRPAGSKSALVHARCAWVDVRQSAAATRHLRAMLYRRRAGRLWTRSRFAAGRSGARRRLSGRSRLSRFLSRHRIRSSARIPSTGIRSGTARKFTGLKYHRITGRDGEKELYDPTLGRSVADAHAGHFIETRASR